jgi:hypothetical protein
MKQHSAQLATGRRRCAKARELTRRHETESAIDFLTELVTKTWQSPLVPSHCLSELLERCRVKPDCQASCYLVGSSMLFLADSQSMSRTLR